MKKVARKTAGTNCTPLLNMIAKSIKQAIFPKFNKVPFFEDITREKNDFQGHIIKFVYTGIKK